MGYMSLSLSGSFSFPHKYYIIIHSSIQHALEQNLCVYVCFIIKVDVSCYDSPHILMLPLQPICPQHRLDKQPGYTHTFSQMHMYTHTHYSHSITKTEHRHREASMTDSLFRRHAQYFGFLTIYVSCTSAVLLNFMF